MAQLTNLGPLGYLAPLGSLGPMIFDLVGNSESMWQICKGIQQYMQNLSVLVINFKDSKWTEKLLDKVNFNKVIIIKFMSPAFYEITDLHNCYVRNVKKILLAKNVRKIHFTECGDKFSRCVLEAFKKYGNIDTVCYENCYNIVDLNMMNERIKVVEIIKYKGLFNKIIDVVQMLERWGKGKNDECMDVKSIESLLHFSKFMKNGNLVINARMEMGGRMEINYVKYIGYLSGDVSDIINRMNIVKLVLHNDLINFCAPMDGLRVLELHGTFVKECSRCLSCLEELVLYNCMNVEAVDWIKLERLNSLKLINCEFNDDALEMVNKGLLKLIIHNDKKIKRLNFVRGFVNLREFTVSASNSMRYVHKERMLIGWDSLRGMKLEYLHIEGYWIDSGVWKDVSPLNLKKLYLIDCIIRNGGFKGILEFRTLIELNIEYYGYGLKYLPEDYNNFEKYLPNLGRLNLEDYNSYKIKHI